MADVGEVGVASVGLRVDGTKIRGDLDKARKQVGKQGKETGTLYAKEFGRSATSGFKTALAGLVSLAAIQQLGRSFLQAALPFNAALAETSTLIDGTVEQTEFLRDTARELARDFGGTGAAQVRAFYQAISAGSETVEDAATLLDTANKLAIGGASNLVTAVDALTSATNAYSGSNLTAAEASDILFVGIKAGKTTAEELGSSIGNVSGLAAQAGVTFQELVGTVATLTSTGVKTSVAMNGLRAILGAVVKPTAEAAKLAEELGLEFNATALASKGLQGFLTDLAQKTGGSTKQIALLFGGLEALGPVMSLLGPLAGKFANTMDDMADAAGATEEAFDKVAESLSQRFDVALAAVGVKAEELGTRLLQVLVPALEATLDNAKALGDFFIVLTATQIPRLIGMLASLAAGLIAAGRAATFLGGPLGIMAGAITLVVTNLGRMRDALGLASTAVADLKEKTDEIVGSMADEIRQTQILSGVIADGTILSKEAAVTKLEEARARLENMRAAIAEGRAVIVSSQAYLGLNAQIKNLEAVTRTGGGGAIRSAAVAEQEAALQRLVEQREALFDTEKFAGLEGASREAVQQIKALDEAISKARDGLVSLGGAAFPVKPETPITTTSTGGEDTGALGIVESIERQIQAQRELSEEIQVTIDTFDQSEVAFDRAIAKLELDRIATELDTAAKEANTDAQRAEIAEAQKLLPLLRQITNARVDDEQALRDHEKAAEDSARKQDALTAALNATGDELVRAIDEGASFIDILKRLAIQLLQIQLNSQRSGTNASGGGFFGDLLGGLVGIVGGAFSGGGFSNIGGSAGISQGLAASSFQGGSIFDFAEGGLPPVGKFSLVGEKGPELAFFGSPARVFSNSDLSDAFSGSEQKSLTLVQNNTFADAPSARDSNAKIARSTAAALRRGVAVS